MQPQLLILETRINRLITSKLRQKAQNVFKIKQAKGKKMREKKKKGMVEIWQSLIFTPLFLKANPFFCTSPLL